MLPFSISANTLVISEIRSELYGYLYQGVTTNLESAQFTFQGNNEDLTLELTGFDIDNATEIAVLVNQQSVGFLSVTPNNGTGASTLSIPASSQIIGENSLSFNQRVPGWRWGVTDLLLSVGLPDDSNNDSTTELQVDIVESTSYGFNYQGVTEHREAAQFTFQGNNENLTLELTGFDIDSATEIAVLVNQQNVGFLSVTPNNGTGTSIISIPVSSQIVGENTLSFIQRRPGWRWGITDLLLSVGMPDDSNDDSIPELQVDIIESTSYGFNYEGITGHRETAQFIFQGNSQDLTLELTGFDIDNATEIAVLVNQQNVGFLSVTPNNGTGTSTLSIPVSSQIAGENSLSFNQRVPGWRWGITDLLLSITAPALEIPIAPTLLSPSAATSIIQHNTTVDFQWEITANATSYQFELLSSEQQATEPLASASLADSSCINTTCTLPILFDFPVVGPLTWRVNASNEAGTSDWSSAEVIALPPTPTTPQNISPTANIELDQGSNATFIWLDDPIADTYDFHIVHPSNPGVLFNNLPDLASASICTNSQCSVDVSLNIPINAGYEWRVLARNAAGASGFSNTTFNIVESITEAPQPPSLISPVAGDIIETNTTATLSWETSELALSYELEIPGNTAALPPLNASACSESICSLTINLDVPANTQHTWRVAAINPNGTAYSVEGAFYTIEAATGQPSAPGLLSPDENAALVNNELATFTWTHDPQVAAYNFHLVNGDNQVELPHIEGLRPPDICSNGICELETLVNLPVFDGHTWNVQASNSQGLSDLSSRLFNAVEPISDPPLPPALISPLPDALLEQEALVNFRWNTSDTASLYQLEIIDTQNPNLETPGGFVPADNCVDDICLLAINLDLPIGRFYEWRVRAQNAAGESDWSSSAMEITAEASQIPPMPMLLSPATGAQITQNESVDFTWARDPHAVTYDFRFFDAITPQTLPFIIGMRADDICSNDQCVVTLPVDLPVGEGHAWFVRGRNAQGTSELSSDTFTVIEEITEIPGEFVLSSPVDNPDIQENTEVTFIWTRAARASSFELELINGTDPNAAPNIVTIDIGACTEDSCSYITTPSLPVSDQHSWRVRAINSIGATDWVSAPLTIIAEPVVLEPAPVIIAPLAGTPVLVDEFVTFEWEPVTDALSYEFYLTDANLGPQPIVSNLLPADHCVDTVCSYSQVVLLLPDSQHSWHVRARLTETDSEWSNTPLTVIPDNTQPIEPVLVDNNVSGGGFQGDVSITEDGLTVYSSADVAGIFKSTDGGLRFEGRNEGLHSAKVASLAITPDNEQILYAGTGDKGTTGGLFRSIDGGDTWLLTVDGSNARFAGNHSKFGDPVPSGHPRSNGDLIVVDPGNNPGNHLDDTVIAGSYKDGVRLFSDGGDNEVSAVNTNGFVRSLAGHPALPDTVFAAIQFSDDSMNGIYEIDYSNVSEPVSTLVYQTLRPEGLTVLSNGHVYGALGTDGIAKYDGTTWTLQNSGLSIGNNNRQWTAVAGYVENDNDIIYAGTTNTGGSSNGDEYSNIWRTVDSGDNWSPLINVDTNVSDTIYGQSHDWWFRIQAFRRAGIGRENSIVSSIAIHRGASAALVSDDIIYVSGRGGIWKSENGGNSWAPAVKNMQATANRDVAVNPNDPSQVVIANTDFVVLESRTGFEGSDISRDKPDDAESRAYDVIVDAVSNEVIIGVGDRDTNNPGSGDVFVKSTSALGAPSDTGWTNTNLRAATASNNGRARAVAYGYHDGTAATTQTILAAVEGEGVFRYHNGNWAKSSGANIGATDRSNFIWPDNQASGVVYLLDLSIGLYRSDDGGQSWENIWPSMSFRNRDFYNAGFIAADDNNPTTLFLSIQGESGSPIGTGFKVYRLEGANTMIFGDPTTPGSPGITDISVHSETTFLARPGPLVVAPDGSLWLTVQQDSRNSVDAGLFMMANPASDTSFTDVTTNDYRNRVASPIGIDVSSDGHIYIAQNGGGLVKLSLP